MLAVLAVNPSTFVCTASGLLLLLGRVLLRNLFVWLCDSRRPFSDLTLRRLLAHSLSPSVLPNTTTALAVAVPLGPGGPAGSALNRTITITRTLKPPHHNLHVLACRCVCFFRTCFVRWHRGFCCPLCFVFAATATGVARIRLLLRDSNGRFSPFSLFNVTVAALPVLTLPPATLVTTEKAIPAPINVTASKGTLPTGGSDSNSPHTARSFVHACRRAICPSTTVKPFTQIGGLFC